MFSSTPVPAVGVSVGVERVFAILEAQLLQRAADSGCRIRESHTQARAQPPEGCYAGLPPYHRKCSPAMQLSVNLSLSSRRRAVPV